MSNDRQSSPPPEQDGWGEYDPEATGFMPLPGGMAGYPGYPGYPDYSAVPPGGVPLAAPGQGYTPPDLGGGEQRPADPPDGHTGAFGTGTAPLTPAATTDPAATGQWTLPFAGRGGTADSAAPGSTGGTARSGGPAAVLGQGAAAALAGAQGAARTQPRTAAEPMVGDAWSLATDGPAGHSAAGRGRPRDAGTGSLTGALPGTDWNAAPGGAGAQWPMPAPEGTPAAEDAAPGSAAPEGTVPEGTVPGSAVPEGTVPEGTVPEGAVPEGAAPGSAVPEGTVPEGTVPEGTVPEGTVSRSAAPDNPAPDNPAPDNPAPDSAASEAGADPAPATDSEHPHTSYLLRVNGTERPVTDVWIGESLLYVLRERLGLAGAKDGCAQGECGACSVQVDGRLVASCLVPAATTAGSEIRTVEGLTADGGLSDVQRALVENNAVQCGFCVPGMAMTLHDLLEGNHAPTELETRTAISGNLCRCSGYRGVLDVVRAVSAERAARAAREAEEAERAGESGGPGAAERPDGAGELARAVPTAGEGAWVPQQGGPDRPGTDQHGFAQQGIQGIPQQARPRDGADRGHRDGGTQ